MPFILGKDKWKALQFKKLFGYNKLNKELISAEQKRRRDRVRNTRFYAKSKHSFILRFRNN